MAKPVNLNKSELKVLSMIPDAGQRELSRQRLLAEKQRKADEKAQAFSVLVEQWNAKKSAPISYAVSEYKGQTFIRIDGTGTRRSAFLTVEKALELVNTISSLKATIVQAKGDRS